MNGFIYIVFGEASFEQFQMSLQSLRRFHTESVTVISDMAEHRFNAEWCHVIKAELPYRTGKYDACFFKTQLWNLTPYERTIYLDCDTLVTQTLEALFKVEGIALAVDYFRDIATLLRNEPITDDWKYTFETCHWYDPYFNTGVIAFKKTNLTLRLFAQWEHELLKTKQTDQYAFVRAISYTGGHVSKLDEAFNKFPYLVETASEARMKGFHLLHFVGELKVKMSQVYGSL